MSTDHDRKAIIDKAIEAVFDNDALECAERGWNRDARTDVAVVPCGNSVIDVRKLVTVVLESGTLVTSSPVTVREGSPYTAAELELERQLSRALADVRHMGRIGSYTLACLMECIKNDTH